MGKETGACDYEHSIYWRYGDAGFDRDGISLYPPVEAGKQIDLVIANGRKHPHAERAESEAVSGAQTHRRGCGDAGPTTPGTSRRSIIHR